ncbi:SprB repeat-containing protein [Mangrovivirga cuniculi]|uniref:Uncharacterized protein n=1 Tax=Mangrovivirga cuniculi TaxID=2715131 RepID=A0A4D7JMI2_9BACT|nr:SprB repeat-containing protein [Mangrovivirga cuniculi]QCK17039.1 hypothetical protein DCC35_08735 [Mangrovivirga cuniculi]
MSKRNHITKNLFLVLFFIISGYTINAQIIITAVSTDVSCNGADDGTVEITIQNGTPDYTLFLFDADAFPGGFYKQYLVFHRILIHLPIWRPEIIRYLCVIIMVQDLQ